MKNRSDINRMASMMGKVKNGLHMMGDDGGFRKAFASNKKAGKKNFEYNGKMYNTETAEEKAKKLSDSELESFNEKSYIDVKKAGFKSKSRNEISNSYLNERVYRYGDKLEEMGLNPNKYSDRMKGNFKAAAFAAKRPTRLK